MARSRWRRVAGGAAAALVLVGALAACGKDDGGNVRDSGSSSGSGTGSDTGSGSGSG